MLDTIGQTILGLEAIREAQNQGLIQHAGFTGHMSRQSSGPANWKCFGLGAWATDAVKGVPADKSASKCNACGICEGKCPNTLEIRKMFRELFSLGELKRTIKSKK